MALRVIFGSVFTFLLGCASAGPSTGLPTEYSKKIGVSSDQEVCFSPDEHCDEKILTFVGSAKKSIDMAAYELTFEPLADELINLSKKISIRIVVYESEATKHGSRVMSLIAAGVSVRYGRQRGLMHNKFTIVDGSMVETGSFNYSEAAVKRNQENQVYLSAPGLVTRFNERFQKMWDAALNP